MATATEREKEQQGDANAVQPFVVEADHHRNSDLLLQAVPGLRLRSAIASAKPAIDNATGDPSVPIDQASFLGHFPRIPGMQIRVEPAKLAYTVTDPLHDDEEMCDRIKRAFKAAERPVSGEIRGVPPKSGKLDLHRMKCLVRELVWIVEAGDARVVRGSLPKLEDVDRLPGRYLLNPGARTMNLQPVFEDGWDDWINDLRKHGG